MDLDRPIFIVSPHRSGSTLLYRRLGKHPRTGYLNRANRRTPNLPRLALLLTRLTPRRVLSDMPRESQNIWDRFLTGPDDVMTAADATPAAVAWHRDLAGRVLALRGVDRLLVKYPRLSVRLAWLDAVFPGAMFLHLKRHWKAVVGSTIARKRKRDRRGGGFFGVRVPGWTEWGEDISHEFAAWRQYRFVTKTLEEEGPTYGADRYREIRYEDLCADPDATFREIAAWTGLDWFPEFENFYPERFSCANDKWMDIFPAEMIEEFRAEDPEFFDAHDPD